MLSDSVLEKIKIICDLEGESDVIKSVLYYKQFRYCKDRRKVWSE
jgi:hypothetical protein